jgi:F-type H+-transporting ATPase subunit epsilon
MPTFETSLVSPEKLVFSGEVDQVDLPGAEGDLGVLAGHEPMVTLLRPGIVVIRAGGDDRKFVVLGGLAELSRVELTILADTAQSIEEFDIAWFRSEIEQLEVSLAEKVPGNELDRAVARLDHYKSIHVSLSRATPF